MPSTTPGHDLRCGRRRPGPSIGPAPPLGRRHTPRTRCRARAATAATRRRARRPGRASSYVLRDPSRPLSPLSNKWPERGEQRTNEAEPGERRRIGGERGRRPGRRSSFGYSEEQGPGPVRGHFRKHTRPLACVSCSRSSAPRWAWCAVVVVAERDKSRGRGNYTAEGPIPPGVRVIGRGGRRPIVSPGHRLARWCRPGRGRRPLAVGSTGRRTNWPVRVSANWAVCSPWSQACEVVPR